MKNRPVASSANQIKDAIGTQSASTRTTLTAVLAIVMLVCAILSAVHGNWVTAGIFGTVLAVLIISLIVGRRADRYNMPVDPEDSPEAIFKEHDV